MIYELLSKRRKKLANAGRDDVYQYDTIPVTLRVQIQQILDDAIGPVYNVDPYSISTPRHNPQIWDLIHKLLCKELGVHRLAPSRNYSQTNEGVLNYIGSADTDGFLDALEICCRFIELAIGRLPEHERKNRGIQQSPTDALEEINYRLKEAAFGYQYSDGQMFRIDSEYTHEEVVKPALLLLRGEAFSGAQDEFLQAHRHYRAEEYPQAITEAAKAFESTLKSVCDIKKWNYEKGSRASDLLKRVRAEGLWPDYLDNSFEQLIATLSSGLPKVRNQEGAHGQGGQVRSVPPYVATYALNLAASKIRLVAEAAELQ